jgi:site-specific recombinase XerD
VGNHVYHVLEPEEWEHLLLACHPPKETGVLAERATARNRAILWVLFDTGMQATEVCRLCLCDVDRERGVLRVRGKGSKQRQLALGQEGLRHLLSYLDDHRLGATVCCEQRGASSDHLFLSEEGCPLTKSGMALLFGRLRQRAGITRKEVTASLLRESFTMRYLQIGGDRCLLQELLGQHERVTVTCSVGMSDEAMENQWAGSV